MPFLRRGRQRQKSSQPFVQTRGPETQLKLNTEDQLTEWKQDSEREFELTVSRLGLFRYQVRLKAEKEMVAVEARLENHSSWDWRDAYAYFHWGLVQLSHLCRADRRAYVRGHRSRPAER